nr:MAG TPA: hypothetical protein [Caudoviricetes sp.]
MSSVLMVIPPGMVTQYETHSYKCLIVVGLSDCIKQKMIALRILSTN